MWVDPIKHLDFLSLFEGIKGPLDDSTPVLVQAELVDLDEDQPEKLFALFKGPMLYHLLDDVVPKRIVH